MPWYEPAPSIEDLDFWKIEGGTLFHQVSQWPHPNTPRVNCRFRVKGSRPTLIPLASRWGFFSTDGFTPYNPLTPPYAIFGWSDAEVRADNHIGFTIPESPDGWAVDVNIKGKDVLDAEGGPGIELEQVTTHTTFGQLRTVSEWPLSFGSSSFRYNQNTWFLRPNPTWTIYENSQNWPQFWDPWIFAVDECYPFKLTPVGMAAMNGTDAYIALDQQIPLEGGPSFFEADVRLRQTDWNPFLAPAVQQSQIAILGTDGTYGARRLDLPDLPAFDVWFKYRIEFEWSSGLQLNYKAWIDDVLQDELTGARVFIRARNIGVRTHSGTPVWGDFDIKNLLFKRGSFASPVTILDMPLIENALDLGPSANHGTTFNMALPSV